MLKALLPGPSYGYAIRKEIIGITGGDKKLSLATLYDALHRLLDDGLIDRAEDKVIDGRTRRTFRILGVGELALSEKERTLRQGFGLGRLARRVPDVQGVSRCG